jgi:hypothetical protein
MMANTARLCAHLPSPDRSSELKSERVSPLAGASADMADWNTRPVGALHPDWISIDTSQWATANLSGQKEKKKGQPE